MKKIKFLGAFIILIIFSVFNVNTIYGISATLSPSSSSVLQGNTFTIKVTLSSDISAANFVLAYNTSKLTLVSGDTSFAWVEGEQLPSYTFKANSGVTGSANISLSGTASDTNYVKSGLSGSTNVNITAPVVTTPTTPTNNTPATTSNNANLKKLVPNYEGLSPNFNPATTKYSLTVPASATKLGLTVGVEATGAKYWINGEDNLQMGDNTVNITVTATDGTKKVYTIIVTKAADVANANAYLNSIVIDGKELKPAFVTETLEYDIGTITSDINKLTVLAYAQSDKAKVEVIGNDNLVEGENIIKIKVTAVDGTTTKEYSIKVIKEAVEEVLATTAQTDTVDNLPIVEDVKEISFFGKIKVIILNNLLPILLITLVIVEFAQVVYLYSKLHKEEIHNFFIKLKLKYKKEDKDQIGSENLDNLDDEKLEDLNYEPIISLEKLDDDIEDDLDIDKSLEEEKNIDHYGDYEDGSELDIDYTFSSLKTLDSLNEEEKTISKDNDINEENFEEVEKEKNEQDNENTLEEKEDKNIFKRRSGFDRKR